jgi:solute carrier family 50 protein (sugar transporter)
MFSTNLIPIMQIRSGHGHIGSTNFVPFLALLTNAVLWTRYGVVQSDKTVVVVNVIGTLIALFALLQFYQYSNTDGKDKLEQFMLLVCGTLFLTLLWLRWSGNVSMLGYLAAGTSVALFGSPLSSVKEVLRTRSAASLNGSFILLGCIVSALWTVYGKKLNDNFIMVPNFIGCLLSIAQGLLYLKFQSGGKTSRPLPV